MLFSMLLEGDFDGFLQSIFESCFKGIVVFNVNLFRTGIFTLKLGFFLLDICT